MDWLVDKKKARDFGAGPPVDILLEQSRILIVVDGGASRTKEQENSPELHIARHELKSAERLDPRGRTSENGTKIVSLI